MSNLRLLTITTEVKMALRWQGVIVLLHGILIVNCLPTETNPIDLDDHYRPQITSILDQLNNNPNRIYNYNCGHLVYAEKKNNEVIDIKLDVDAECLNREICSSVSLACRGYVKYFPQENKFQALSEVQCHVKSPIFYSDDVPQVHMLPPVEEEKEIVADKINMRTKPCLGCLMELDKNAVGMEPFLDLALQHIQSERDAKHLIVNVINVQRQVVAGVRYIFVLEIVPTLCPKSVHITHNELCPIDNQVQPEVCRIEFFQKPNRNSNKEIISNNCTMSQLFTAKETKLNNRNDLNNEIDMQGYRKPAKLHEFDTHEEHSGSSPNFDQIAESGNFENIGLTPQRLAALEAQIIPFISVETTKAGSLDNSQLGVEDIPSVQTSTDSFNDNDDVDDIMKLREKRATTSEESNGSSEEKQKQRVTRELQQKSDESESSEETKQPEKLTSRQVRQKRELQQKSDESKSSEETKHRESSMKKQKSDESKSSEETKQPETLTSRQVRQKRELQQKSDESKSSEETKHRESSMKQQKSDESKSSEETKQPDNLASRQVRQKRELQQKSDESKSSEETNHRESSMKTRKSDESKSSEETKQPENLASRQVRQKRELQQKSDESKSSEETKHRESSMKKQKSDESKSSEETKQPENLASRQVRQKRELQLKANSDESGSSSGESKQQENSPVRLKRQVEEVADVSKSSSEETRDPKPESTKLKRASEDSSSEEDIHNNEDHAEKTEGSLKEPNNNKDENSSSESEENGKKIRKRRAADDNSSSSSNSNEKGNDNKKEEVKDKNNKDDDSSSSSDDDKNNRKKRAANNGNNDSSSSSSSSSSSDDDDNNGNDNNGNDNNGNDDDNNHKEKKHHKKAHSNDNKKKVSKKEDKHNENNNNDDSSSSSSSSDDNDNNNNNNRRKRNTDENKSNLKDLIKKIADFAADSFNDDEHKHKVLEVLRVKKIELEGAVYHLSLRIGMSKCSDGASCMFDSEKLCKVQMHVSKSQQMKVLKSHCHNMGSEFDKNRTNRRFSRQIPGGVNNINIDDKIKNLTSGTLLQLDGESEHDNKYKIVEILEAKKQVVSGLLYRIKAKIILSDCPKTDSKDPQLCGELKEADPRICDIVVWDQPWLPQGRKTNVTCETQEFYFRTRRDTTNQLLGNDDHHIHYGLFKKFMVEHNKIYQSKQEMLHRFRVFRENMLTAEFLNRHEQGTATYGATKFADLTESEFKNYLGYRSDLRHENDIEFAKAKIPKIDLPKEFDWRKKGVVTEVKNQGGCGSCWAFSVTGNVEGQYAIKHGELQEFSEQELVDCDTVDQGCNGGLMDNAYRVIEKLGGLETEKAYPYEGENEKCHFNQSLTRVQLSGALNISQDETAMAKWLVKNGPISIAINANAMQLYMGGISHPLKFLCNPKNLDHGVLIVGYGVHEYKLFHKTLPYWIVKNSWGPSWGEQGYYRVYRGDGTCGVNQTPSSAIVE